MSWLDAANHVNLGAENRVDLSANQVDANKNWVSIIDATGHRIVLKQTAQKTESTFQQTGLMQSGLVL